MIDRRIEDRGSLVAVLAPTGRDGPLTEQVLSRWDIDVRSYDTMPALIDAIRRGVGTVIVAEEALGSKARADLVTELERQPSWSDLPLIVLTAEGELSRALAAGIEGLASRSNVTLLERPVRVATLVTTVRSALRARVRQYDVRDHIVLLSEARSEAEAANRAKLEFLAMMSHELRTPLNAIGGYAELLELGVRGKINEEQRDDLARIQRSQRHLLGLINGVLNFARIERGTVDYNMEKVSMRDLVKTAESLIAPQAKAKGLILEFESCTDELLGYADRDKLEQVVLNLLGNAVKFTRTGGRIHLSCERRSDSVAVVVSDTGRGIPQDKMQAIFEPFVQVDSRLTRSQDGVGLGLAISRDLARGMGGDLTAESRLGEGSTFTLTLRAA